jgi:aminoglycoside 6'-N-acetyltransferase I
MAIAIRLLRSGDESVLGDVAPSVFDDPIDPAATRAFLTDPRHHLAVALDQTTVVGFTSAVHYLHPDKPKPEMWINEVSVADTHRERGVGRALMDAMLAEGRRVGATEAWVLTDRDNPAAIRLYQAAGGEERHPDPVMFNFTIRG